MCIHIDWDWVVLWYRMSDVGHQLTTWKVLMVDGASNSTVLHVVGYRRHKKVGKK